MSRPEPRVSIIIPVYNGERFLAEAIQSIIDQGIEDAEVLIVDDGSNDGTAGIARGFGDKVIYLYQKRAGPAAARNLGLRHARRVLTSFLDSDDLWPLGRLSRMMKIMDSEPDLQILCGKHQRLLLESSSEEGDQFRPFGEAGFFPLLGCMLIRATVFEQVGLFDKGLIMGEDVDWFLRCREKGVYYRILEETTLVYRTHGENMTRDSLKVKRSLVLVAKRALDRRRLKGGHG